MLTGKIYVLEGENDLGGVEESSSAWGREEDRGGTNKPDFQMMNLNN